MIFPILGETFTVPFFYPLLWIYLFTFNVGSSNGKIDKRVLRDLAINKIEADEKNLVTDIPVKSQEVKAKLYDQNLYEEKSLAAGILPTLATPPPVYQSDLQIALREKSSVSGDVSSSSSSDTIDVSSSSELGEKSNFWDGYKDDTLPEKTQRKFFRNIRHQVFSLYRRLFGVVFTANMAVLIYTLVRGLVNAQHLGLVVVANLFCAILMRQDYVINTFFTVFCAVPSSCVGSILYFLTGTYPL